MKNLICFVIILMPLINIHSEESIISSPLEKLKIANGKLDDQKIKNCILLSEYLILDKFNLENGVPLKPYNPEAFVYVEEIDEYYPIIKSVKLTKDTQFKNIIYDAVDHQSELETMCHEPNFRITCFILNDYNKPVEYLKGTVCFKCSNIYWTGPHIHCSTNLSKDKNSELLLNFLVDQLK